LEAASAPETFQKAWVIVRMQFNQNVYGYQPCLLKTSYLSSCVFTAMLSVHIRINSSLSPPPKKKSWIRLWQ